MALAMEPAVALQEALLTGHCCPALLAAERALQQVGGTSICCRVGRGVQSWPGVGPRLGRGRSSGRPHSNDHVELGAAPSQRPLMGPARMLVACGQTAPARGNWGTGLWWVLAGRPSPCTHCLWQTCQGQWVAATGPHRPQSTRSPNELPQASMLRRRPRRLVPLCSFASVELPCPICTPAAPRSLLYGRRGARQCRWPSRELCRRPAHPA